MNLVPNRGVPSFYLPRCFARSESLLALDFDPRSRVVELQFRSDEW